MPIRGTVEIDGNYTRIAFDADGKPIMPETATKETPKLDIPLPDPTIGVTERNEYGYTWEGMLPLAQNRALQLYDSDSQVYLLYNDGAEAAAFEREDIEQHEGIFGIEIEDWEKSKDYAAMTTAIQADEAARESELL
ncbi:MAG: hypothetical protein LBD23_01895, partial [Oscillospiraceae bacterium]|nr:hypothetical protein [Oscillospiraceae bacterium]